VAWRGGVGLRFRRFGRLVRSIREEQTRRQSRLLSFFFCVYFLLYIVFACDFPNSGSFGFHGFLLFVLIFLVLRQRENK
jgi:hypothetical protein